MWVQLRLTLFAVALIVAAATGAYLGVRSLAIPAPSAFDQLIQHPREPHADKGGHGEPHKPPPWTYAWFTHDATGVFTILLCGITALLAYFTLKLWSATGGLVAGAEDTAIRQLRAYVGLELDPKPYPPKTETQKPNRWAVSLIVTNRGNTRARKVKIDSWRAELPKNIDFDPWDRCRWWEKESHSFLLDPHQSVTLQFRDFTFEEAREMVDGPNTLYYMAWATYEDVVSKQRVTLHTQLSRVLRTDKEGGVAFGYQGPHNCADDDCPQPTAWSALVAKLEDLTKAESPEDRTAAPHSGAS